MELPSAQHRSSATSGSLRIALSTIVLTTAVTVLVTACGDDLKFPGQLADTPTPGPTSSGTNTPTPAPTTVF